MTEREANRQDSDTSPITVRGPDGRAHRVDDLERHPRRKPAAEAAPAPIPVPRNPD